MWRRVFPVARHYCTVAAYSQGRLTSVSRTVVQDNVGDMQYVVHGERNSEMQGAPVVGSVLGATEFDSADLDFCRMT